jgi:stage V sporulation protein S
MAWCLYAKLRTDGLKSFLTYWEVKNMETLKVSSKSEPKSVAGAIAAIVRNGEVVEISAIGAAAVNQAVKSVAVARGYVAPNGIDLVCIPAF